MNSKLGLKVSGHHRTNITTNRTSFAFSNSQMAIYWEKRYTSLWTSIRG